MNYSVKVNYFDVDGKDKSKVISSNSKRQFVRELKLFVLGLDIYSVSDVSDTLLNLPIENAVKRCIWGDIDKWKLNDNATVDPEKIEKEIIEKEDCDVVSEASKLINELGRVEDKLDLPQIQPYINKARELGVNFVGQDNGSWKFKISSKVSLDQLEELNKVGKSISNSFYQYIDGDNKYLIVDDKK